MKSKHFMHWFFWGEKMSKLTEVNLVENIIKKNSFLNCSQLWMWMKGAIRNKEAMNTMDTERWHLLHMCPDSFEVSSTFAATCFSFIHSFICAFSDFPINCKGFFFLSSVAFQTQWMSINHFQFFAFYMAFLLPISNLGRGKWC